MNTSEIAKILNCNEYTNKYFKGVYSLDKIPNFKKRPALLVINTDLSSEPGEHWVAIFLPKKGYPEFFDSYGRRPQKKEFLSFLIKNFKRYVYNKKRLQSSFSAVCGQYCCVFLWFRSFGQSMKEFLKNFDSTNYAQNDKLVKQFFKFIFHCKNNIYKKGCIQNCKPISF